MKRSKCELSTGSRMHDGSNPGKNNTDVSVLETQVVKNGTEVIVGVVPQRVR